MDRPPLPPFDLDAAAQKARMAENAWNTRDPARVALAYTPDSRWRNRAEFLQGRDAIQAFLLLDKRLRKAIVENSEARAKHNNCRALPFRAHTPRSPEPGSEVVLVAEIALRFVSQAVAQRNVRTKLPVILHIRLDIEVSVGQRRRAGDH